MIDQDLTTVSAVDGDLVPMAVAALVDSIKGLTPATAGAFATYALLPPGDSPNHPKNIGWDPVLREHITVSPPTTADGWPNHMVKIQCPDPKCRQWSICNCSCYHCNNIYICC